MRPFEAQSAVEAAALRSIATHYYDNPADPNGDASDELAADELAMAARDLVRAIEALPVGERPIGWDEHSHGPFSTTEA